MTVVAMALVPQEEDAGINCEQILPSRGGAPTQEQEEVVRALRRRRAPPPRQALGQKPARRQQASPRAPDPPPRQPRGASPGGKAPFPLSLKARQKDTRRERFVIISRSDDEISLIFSLESTRVQ